MMWTAICPSNSLAQVSDRFPDSVQTEIDSTRYQAFDLGGFTELLAIDADLSYYSSLAHVLTQNTLALRDLAHNLQLRVDSLLTQRDLLATERARLRTMWSNENRLRHEAENKIHLGSVLGWVISAVLAATTVTLGIVVLR